MIRKCQHCGEMTRCEPCPNCGNSFETDQPECRCAELRTLLIEALEELRNYRNDCSEFEGPENVQALDQTIARIDAELARKE